MFNIGESFSPVTPTPLNDQKLQESLMTLSLYNKKQYGNSMFCVGSPCLGVGVDPVLDMVVLLHAHLVPAPHPRVVREQDLDLLVGRDVRSL